jgi:hypothetical protein
MQESRIPRKADGQDARLNGRRLGRPLRATLERLIDERLPA